MNHYWTLKQHFGRVLLDFQKTQIQITNKDKLNTYTYLHTKYTKLYTTHIYEITEFSSKIGFPGNSIFKLSKWVITLTDLSSNLIRQEPFETQNDSTTLLNQG